MINAEKEAMIELERCRHMAQDENMPEAAHQEADSVLLYFLRKVGYGHIADAWHKVGRKFYDIPFWWESR